MAVVALVSGGIDSLVMCKLLEKDGQEIMPIFVDYGQLACKKEWESCKRIFKISNLSKPERIDLNGYGKSITSGITDSSKDICVDAFLPGRNLIFLIVAASYAFQRGIKNIAIGLLSEKTHLFPDQTEEFLVNANFAINSALGEYITILTPLINFSKDNVIKLAEKFNLPIEQTYSCHSGRDSYCGKCIACREIIDSADKDLFPQFSNGGG
ncbi:MAG: 7-cyano-7-deazaguanine synthase [Theionarchaea archaeon]|nr:7-cyano-7-deazaguanine synthase [Theionarchaea archaeon]